MLSEVDEQKKLSNIIKEVHQNLREASKEVGAEVAWGKHLADTEKLEMYAMAMNELNTKHWIKNTQKEDRIEWIITCCKDYFYKDIMKHRESDFKAIKRLQEEGEHLEIFTNYKISHDELEVLDVGSCGNFFKNRANFKLTAIDIAPSSPDVKSCDFLSVPITKDKSIVSEDNKLIQLQSNSYDAIFFCLLLEYLPSSHQRYICCQKAYEILRPEGILIIITPDSSSQHKNASLLKTWRKVLARIGFRRIKVEKLLHLSCLAFRKSLCNEISSKWAGGYEEIEMGLEIPQDRQKEISINSKNISVEFEIDLLKELPFQ